MKRTKKELKQEFHQLLMKERETQGQINKMLQEQKKRSRLIDKIKDQKGCNIDIDKEIRLHKYYKHKRIAKKRLKFIATSPEKNNLATSTNKQENPHAKTHD